MSRLKNIFIAAWFVFIAAEVLPVQAAMDPRFELDPQLLGRSQSLPKKTGARTEQHSSKRLAGNPVSATVSKGTLHTIQAGDNLFKILMRDFGLSNGEAELFIDEIRRENNIYDIRRLKIGQKINIPPIRRRADGSLKYSPDQSDNAARPAESSQAFRLVSPLAPLSDQEASARIKQVWNSLMPPVSGEQKPVTLQSPAFSLTLDPARYPVFTAMNGGRILVDQNASIPPLVRSLITEKDPTVRIVSESPRNGRQFIGAMLESAGFYSVEENFSMDFGTDPKLTVLADFKVEKNPDSLIKQDVALLNAGRLALPASVGEFLKKEGFALYEPFAAQRPALSQGARQFIQITTKNQTETVDAILKSLSVLPERDRHLDVFGSDNNGISLTVKAERFFEFGGRRIIVTRFDGDPLTYTLFRILETKGYQVVMLETLDDFKKVSEKLLSRLQLNSAYGQQTVAAEAGANYSLFMSGFKLEGAGVPGGGVFLTNLELDKIIRELLTENGYTITTR